jgi:ribosomal protein S18 acetylase RimI-like enzyme
MSTAIEYLSNKATEAEIVEHLLRCDADFVLPLSRRVNVNDYAKKISTNATRFEAWSGDTLIGIVAVYFNDPVKHTAYITNVSILRAWRSKGIASRLVGQCIEQAKTLGMGQIKLEVAVDNAPAIDLYEKRGFISEKTNGLFVSMYLNLKAETV